MVRGWWMGTRVALAALLLGACDSEGAESVGTEGTTSTSSSTGDPQPGTSGENEVSTASGSSSGDADEGSGDGEGSTGTESSGTTTGAGSESSGSSESGSRSTGEPCDLGTHGCDCLAGECVGDLICGESGRCYAPGECQEINGTENCPCADGACFGELQCWQDTCVASCTEDPDNDDQHCGGTCGNECTITADLGGCVEGVCAPHFSECHPTADALSCPEICAAEGKVCSLCPEDEHPAGDYSWQVFQSEADCEAIQGGSPRWLGGMPTLCDGTPSISSPWVRCCCE